MPKMRAKLVVDDVAPFYGPDIGADEVGGKAGEVLTFRGSETARRLDLLIRMTVTNPELFDGFKVGEEYYIDFIKAE